MTRCVRRFAAQRSVGFPTCRAILRASGRRTLVALEPLKARRRCDPSQRSRPCECILCRLAILTPSHIEWLLFNGMAVVFRLQVDGIPINIGAMSAEDAWNAMNE